LPIADFQLLPSTESIWFCIELAAFIGFYQSAIGNRQLEIANDTRLHFPRTGLAVSGDGKESF
jgi:hypothetical protein